MRKSLNGKTIFRIMDVSGELTDAEIVDAIWRAAEQKKVNAALREIVKHTRGPGRRR
jgi:hypothetical protein